jgi:DNA-nicking Smr family endonuclease
MNFLHMIFSPLARLLNRRREKEAAVPVVRPVEPVPPPDHSPTPPPVKRVKKTPSPSLTPAARSKSKRKKTAPPLKKRLDKKGFHILSDSDDLHRLFLGDTDKTGHGEEENFAQMFEKSRTDIYQQVLLKEKIHDIHNQLSRPLTVSERLKQYPPPQAEVDLHGCTAAEAEKKTETFIRNARLRGIRTVRIIVGKGLHSKGQAVLPDVTEDRIIELKRRNRVLSYKWEKKDKRKSGAVIIYLVPH